MKPLEEITGPDGENVFAFQELIGPVTNTGRSEHIWLVYVQGRTPHGEFTGVDTYWVENRSKNIPRALRASRLNKQLLHIYTQAKEIKTIKQAFEQLQWDGK